ncbi:MAG TPA: tripartite tricarboxylate transporter substrate-binding protein [Gammaproteobacteria bacterium]
MFAGHYARTLFLAALLLAGAGAAAQDVADFYQGRTVTILVGSGAGGITDTSARIVGRYLEQYLPGTPTVIVQNMPGGGSVTMANHMYRRVAPDGLTLGYPLPGILTAQLMEPNRARYDAREFTWIGSLFKATNTLSVRAPSPVQTIDDARETEIIIGSTGRGSPLYQFPAMTKALLDLPMRIITGYEGSGDITLAMDRGEVDGQGPALDYWEISRPGWVTDGSLVHLVHIGPRDAERIPDVPHLRDLVQSDRERRLVEFLEIGANLGWPLFAPPGVPEDRVNALRSAFGALTQNAEFAADVRQTIGSQLNPTVGEDLEAFVLEAIATPAATVDEAKAILGLD